MVRRRAGGHRRDRPAGAHVHTFGGKGGATWQIYPPKTPKEKKVPLAWNSFATPIAPDDTTYGYKWTKRLVTKLDAPDGALVTLPEYYRLEKDGKKDQWVVVKPRGRAGRDRPGEGAISLGPRRSRPKPYVTPDEADSCWKKPGPAAGPFEAKLGDGSVVTYYWYRFADQPALLNADLTEAERETLQKRVEMLHRNWTKDREYLPPPTVGKLADLDPRCSSPRRRAWKSATCRSSRDRSCTAHVPSSSRTATPYFDHNDHTTMKHTLTLITALLLALLTTTVFAQQPPYDVFPPADPPYYRVRYEASTKPGELIYPVNYTIWIPKDVKSLRGVIVHQHGCGEGSCKSGLTGAYDSALAGAGEEA